MHLIVISYSTQVLGNSFQKKMALFFGINHAIEVKIVVSLLIEVLCYLLVGKYNQNLILSPVILFVDFL